MTPPHPVTEGPGGTHLDVRVIPRARRSGLQGQRDGAVLVRVTAPPVDGLANEALLDVLADALDVARRRLSITSGATSRHKRVLVEGLTPRDVYDRLAGAR